MRITRVHPTLGARVEGVGLGGPMDEATFKRIFDAFQEHSVLVFRWKQWDLVMWDNRCILHRGRPWDAARHKRVMRRTTIAGEGPTADPPLATRTPAWEGIIAAGVGV
jgi:alpha-ketoglutarate-dependent taurine dioxygenase